MTFTSVPLRLDHALVCDITRRFNSGIVRFLSPSFTRFFGQSARTCPSTFVGFRFVHLPQLTLHFTLGPSWDSTRAHARRRRRREPEDRRRRLPRHAARTFGATPSDVGSSRASRPSKRRRPGRPRCRPGLGPGRTQRGGPELEACAGAVDLHGATACARTAHPAGATRSQGNFVFSPSSHCLNDNGRCEGRKAVLGVLFENDHDEATGFIGRSIALVTSRQPHSVVHKRDAWMHAETAQINTKTTAADPAGGPGGGGAPGVRMFVGRWPRTLGPGQESPPFAPVAHSGCGAVNEHHWRAQHDGHHGRSPNRSRQ